MSQIDDFLDGKAAPSAAPKVSAIDAFLGEDKPKEPGLARGAADTAIAGATGLVSGVQMLSNVAGADNPVSRGLGKANEFLADLESPYRKAEKQDRAKKIKAAEESGSTWEEVKAYAGAFGEAPLDTTVNALGTSVPTLAAAFLTGGASVPAQVAARALPLAIGGAQGAGAVKGQIYEAVEQEHLKAGKTPEEAAALASKAQAYDGKNTGQIAAATGLGMVAGTSGAEAAARRFVGGKVAKDAAMGIGKAAGLGVLKETPVEMLQGGQERVASNLALQNEGFDTPTWQGVAGQAALEGLASAPMGAGFGMLDARGGPTVNPNTAAEPPAQPPAPQPPNYDANALQALQQTRLDALASEEAGAPDVPQVPPPDGAAALAAQTERANRARQAMIDLSRATESPDDEILQSTGMGTPPMKPSVSMGIDPNAGVISKVAAEAVDGPASMEMAVRQAEREMAALAAEDNPEAGADARPTFNDPLEAQVAAYVGEMGTASPQMVASKFGVTIPRATELLAQADPTVDDLFPPPQGGVNVSNADAPGSVAAGTGGPVGVDAAGSGPDAGLLEAATGSGPAGDTGAPGPAVQEGDTAPVPGRDSDKALTKGPTNTKAKVKGLKDVIARNKAAKANVQDQPQGTAPAAAAPAPAPEVQAPQAVGSDGVAQPGAATAGRAGVEADGVVPASTDATGKPASWVIRNKDTGEVVMETFDRAKVQALNTAKYEAVPVKEYLASLNKKTPSPTTTEPTNGTQAAQAVETKTEGREETALLSDSVKPASKYQLPQGRVFDSWRDAKKRVTDHPDYEPTPRQQMLMDEVAKAADAGAFYDNDVKDAVAKALGVDAETRAANTTGVEGGDFGMDVYLAGRALDAKRKNASEKAAAKELNLKAGDKLGTLVFNDMKVTNSVEVESVSDDGLSYNFKGKRGPVGVKFSTGPVSVKGAIERAHEKGKRKDSYEQFIAARKASAAPAVAAPAPSQQAQAPAAAPSEPQETTHNGARIYRTRAKLGDEVKTMWAVETPENKARRAAGERALGGDTLHDTIEQAKAAADREAKQYAERKAFTEEQDKAERARKEADEARKAGNRGKSILERRKDAVLDGQSKLPASAGLGNTTRRNAMQMAVDQGRAVVERQVDDTAAKKRDQEAIERVRRAGYMLGLSNENIPVVKAGLEAQARLKANDYKKPEYRVYAGSEPTGGFFEITKIEYEYAQELMAEKAAKPAAAPAVQPTVDQAANEAATSPSNDLPEPTQAQKEAGNYKKGHVQFDGLDLTVENPVGSTRSGMDPSGKPWEVTMTAHYGYHKRTTGADGDQVDVYLADNPVAGSPVFVFDQFNADGSFDEHKAVAGVATEVEAIAIYDAHFSDGSGPKRRRTIKAMTPAEFKAWAMSDAAKQPLASEVIPAPDGMKKIWDGSEPTSAVTGQRPAFATAAIAAPDSESSQGSSNARGQADSVAQPIPEAQAETPKLTQAEAKALMEWQDLGQKNGIKTHILTFYESKADKDAKRGRMTIATVSKHVEAGNWQIADDSERFTMLGMAKKKAEQVGMARAVADGFVESAAAAPEVPKKGLGGAREVPVIDKRAPAAAGVADNFGEELPPARRTMATKLSEDLTDDKIASLPLSQIWPTAENEAIEDVGTAAAAHVMREAIPAKPRVAYKVKAWVEKVKFLRDFAAKVVRGDISRDRLMEEMQKVYALRDLAAKIKLLEQIDRAQWKRIGDVSEAPNAVRYEEGKAVPSPSSSVNIDGRSHWLRGSGNVLDHIEGIKAMLGDGAPEAKMQFEIRQEGRGERKVFINKKGDKEYRRLMEFATVDEARKALKEQYADLVAAWEGVKGRDNITERDLRSDTNRDRTGKDHRKGRDVTAEEFESKFGFRGGEFGKWVGQGKGAQERQFMLNSAYDALMDLSDLLGIPPKAISLEGSLGIAFGSRGSGWASAHFEPSNLVINLTKTRGAGALAHEWFHALDNYFARKRNGGEVPIRAGSDAQSEYRRNNYITHKTSPMMVRKDGRGSPVTKERLVEWRKSSADSAYLAPENWMEDPNHKQGVRAEVEQAFADLVKTLNDTPMLKRARRLDGVKDAEGYWSRMLEMAARSFENYVQTRMMEQGYHNDFLANVKEAPEVGKNVERYPYLLPSEIAPVADAFKALFDTIQTKEDDAGNVAMFSRAQAPASGIPVQTTQQIVDTIKARWKNAPEVVVLADMNDPRVPEAVRKGDAEQRSGGATGEPEGFYYKGTAYVVAGSLKTPGDVVRVLLHESLGHHGLRGTFGDGLKPILAQIANMRKSEVQAKAAEYGLDMEKESDRLQAAEEVLAVMAQNNPQAGFVKRAIGAIRAWLRENVPMFANMRLTDNDIVTQFILPARRFVQQGPAGRVGDGVPAMSRSDNAGMLQTTSTSPAVTKLNRVMRGAGWEIEYIELDLTGEKPKVAIRVNRDDGRFMIAKVDSVGRASFETFQRERALRMDGSTKGRRPLTPMVDDTFLGRQKFEGARSMLRGMVNYLVDNASNPVALSDMKSAWAGAMAAPVQQDMKAVEFAPTSDGVMFSRSPRELAGMATDQLKMTLTAPGKLSWWSKTVGTMYGLAERHPAFKPVFNAAQSFIDDVSYYATDAADMAPKMLPKLENWRDITKSPISAEDNKAIEAPVNEGTLLWARDELGRPVKVAELEAQAADMTADQKARRLLRNDKISDGVLKMWQGLPQEQYEKLIDSRYESQMLAPGVVWTDAELKAIWKLNDTQIGLYREVRAAIDKSLDNLAKSDLVRFVGKDGAGIKDAIMEADSVDAAALLARDYFIGLSEAEPDRAEMLLATANGVMDRADKVTRLKAQGYAPLSRFGKYTVDVVTEDGRQYFGLFESMREANQMAARMKGEFGKDAVSQGTLSDESFKLFQGITPETLELFGNMLGLSDTGDTPQDQAFQAYLKLTKNNRSAMKRLIQRKGILGYSQDVGRVLANFIYSNARQTASALHIGDLTDAINAIPQGQGEVKDVAVKLGEYIKNPQEEAQAFRGLLFAQYLGGNISSAIINALQPFQVSFPYLSQFGGVKQAGAEMMRATREVATGKKQLDPELAAAIKRGEDDGTLSPQEVFQLMAQAKGAGSLRSGDGTLSGDLLAKGGNAWSKTALAWGKVFGVAEQFNRRSTFIAAYRIAKAQKIADPFAFAKKTVKETQFVYSKANRPQWARGAIGSTIFTFKTYSISYIELLHRMATQGGPEGKRAALLAVAVLLLMGGAGGLPFMEDGEDIADTIAQVMGYNFSSKQAKQELLEELFGEAAAQFIDRGISGVAGVPIDVSGRFGMGNLIPGTGAFLQRNSNARDVLEVLGPAGDLIQRGKDSFMALAKGNVYEAGLNMSPVAIRNLAKGADMADTGMYRDTKGFKVIETTGTEAGLKAIGFQPNTVAKVQEANYLMQRQKDFYNTTAQNIRAKWARGLFEQDDAMVAEAREAINTWNEKNPDQRMSPNMPAIWRRVREMAKDKDQRIADTAPKAMRQQFREETARVREAL